MIFRSRLRKLEKSLYASLHAELMVQMVERPSTTPTGQDRETLTFEALHFYWCMCCASYVSPSDVLFSNLRYVTQTGYSPIRHQDSRSTV